MSSINKKDDFFQQVHQVVQLIPKGKVSSYGAIAEYLGAKKAARTVGYAMNKSHKDSTIPAHRVLNRNGILTGKNQFTTPTLMQELLENEGHTITNNQIENFDLIFWDPSKELL